MLVSRPAGFIPIGVYVFSWPLIPGQFFKKYRFIYLYLEILDIFMSFRSQQLRTSFTHFVFTLTTHYTDLLRFSYFSVTTISRKLCMMASYSQHHSHTVRSEELQLEGSGLYKTFKASLIGFDELSKYLSNANLSHVLAETSPLWEQQ